MEVIKRKIYQFLKEWKASPERKPLILQGARQVGKTYIVNLFGKHEYNNFVYCNFEEEKELKSLFDTLEPKTILQRIGYYKKKEIIPGHTLIIFDEVQACPEALTSLKYFNERANEYHIIATGSLLGIAVNRNQYSFPVGKVQFKTMLPLDFEEFLWAQHDNYSVLVNEIKSSYQTNKPLPKLFHEDALNLYRQYLFVGGMPEVVDVFVRTGNYELVRIKQRAILESYFDDMSKYNSATEVPKTKLVFENISTQLAKENRKFKYSDVKKGGRSRDFEQSIKWICTVGIASQLYRLEQVKLPLEAYRVLDDFKFYMNDIGLCCASQKILPEDVLNPNSDFNDFKGGLTENYVNNQLIANEFDLYYWTSKSDAEIDFITRIGVDIIPIEVKANDNTRSKSLNVYISTMKPKYAIRISGKNFGFENNIKSVPLYAVFCICK